MGVGHYRAWFHISGGGVAGGCGIVIIPYIIALVSPVSAVHTG